MEFLRLNLKTAVAALGVSIAVTGFAHAQNVTLKANDGSVSVEGELIEFTDGFYQIRTDLGLLRLSAERVTCEGEGCPKIAQVVADLTFTGSNTLGQGIMPLLLAGFASELNAEADVRNGPRPGTAVAELVADGGFGAILGTYLIESTNSDDAFDALLENRAQIGMSARRITPVEARALRAAGSGNMVDVRQERIVAIDPLTVIVNPANPVDTLKEEDVVRIFSGQVTNWSEVGGPDAPISVFSREPGSATRDFFDEFMMRGAVLTQSAITVADNNKMAAAVNEDPNGIGFVGYAFQRGAKPLALHQTCGILSAPSPFTAKTEEYPLDRRLYLYAREDTLTPDAEKFLDFATSPKADGAIAKAGFVNLGIVRRDGPLDAEKAQSLLDAAEDNYERGFIEKLIAERANWNQLSSTFRFSTGSSRLDIRGVADLPRLAEYLAEQPAGTEVAMVGFTDSDGAFEGNMALGQGRAQQVVSELTALAGPQVANIKFQAIGYGELMPAACNDTKEGKRINRRVEVWIRNPSAS